MNLALIRYLGHSSFELELGGKTLLADPWFNEKPKEANRLIPPAVKAEQVRKADFVLVSHEHFDHCDPFDVKAIASRNFSQVIAPDDSLALIDLNPRQKVNVSEGDEFSLLGVDFIITHARHPQSTNPVGFIIKTGGKSIYYAGDTYDFYAMNKIQVDAAILPIGGTYTMDVLAAIKALKTLKASYVVPMHYNTFDNIRCDVIDFEKRVKRDTKAQPVVLGVGESFTI